MTKSNCLLKKLKDIFSFIPPTDLFRVMVKSKTGAQITGVYIDTFIDPGKLDVKFIKTNISKVERAATHAKKMRAKIVTLGGFTSIVLEGNLNQFSSGDTKFTTGNTLTAAYIVKGLEKAAIQNNINLPGAAVLIIGATGDIGLACINYLKNKVKKLLLCARNNQRLEKLSQSLIEEHKMVGYSVSLQQLIPEADIVICVASSRNISLAGCKKNVLICDAGYPKNLETKIDPQVAVHLFHGGMGQVGCGFNFNPDYSAAIYQYPAPYIIHGCILEAMILAFENRFEDFSSGKGSITITKMEEIYNLSLKHGIAIAPFYNTKGLW